MESWPWCIVYCIIDVFMHCIVNLCDKLLRSSFYTIKQSYSNKECVYLFSALMSLEYNFGTLALLKTFAIQILTITVAAKLMTNRVEIHNAEELDNIRAENELRRWNISILDTEITKLLLYLHFWLQLLILTFSSWEFRASKCQKNSAGFVLVIFNKTALDFSFIFLQLLADPCTTRRCISDIFKHAQFTPWHFLFTLPQSRLKGREDGFCFCFSRCWDRHETPPACRSSDRWRLLDV